MTSMSSIGIRWPAVVMIASAIAAASAIVATRSAAPPSKPSPAVAPRMRMQYSQSMHDREASYRAALEVRENVEFLLSPAILIQQSLHEDEVISYPNE